VSPCYVRLRAEEGVLRVRPASWLPIPERLGTISTTQESPDRAEPRPISCTARRYVRSFLLTIWSARRLRLPSFPAAGAGVALLTSATRAAEHPYPVVVDESVDDSRWRPGVLGDRGARSFFCRWGCRRVVGHVAVGVGRAFNIRRGVTRRRGGRCSRGRRRGLRGAGEIFLAPTKAFPARIANSDWSLLSCGLVRLLV
jgi:hypothetical protein